MLMERLRQLFTAYDPTIQTIISEVLTLEQEHISMERPRIKDQIDEIISRVASKVVERTETAEIQD
jgi:hypothetical protein